MYFRNTSVLAAGSFTTFPSFAQGTSFFNRRRKKRTVVAAASFLWGRSLEGACANLLSRIRLRSYSHVVWQSLNKIMASAWLSFTWPLYSHYCFNAVRFSFSPVDFLKQYGLKSQSCCMKKLCTSLWGFFLIIFLFIVKRTVLTYYWKFLPINNVHVICLPYIVQFTLLYYVTIIIDWLSLKSSNCFLWHLCKIFPIKLIWGY